MKKEVIPIPGIKEPDSPFNHVVKAGDFLFLTSQLSADLKTGEIISGDIAEQTERALNNVEFLLHSCGSSLENVLKAVVYLRDVGDFEEMNRVYRRYFESAQAPARVTIQSPSPVPGIDIEIEVTALIPGVSEE